MTDRVELLASLKSEDIDDIARAAAAHGLEEPQEIDALRRQAGEVVSGHYPDALSECLVPLEKLSDAALVRRMRERLAVARFDPDGFSDRGLIATKINHGFWEHLAYLNTKPEHRVTYRDVNLAMRQSHYLTSDFMPVLLGSFLTLMQDPSVHCFVSCITGIRSFEQLFGRMWLDPFALENAGFEMTPSRRGAVKGLLAFSELALRTGVGSRPIVFYDSYEINQSFSEKRLLDGMRADADVKTLCLIVGPPRLSVARVAAWPGPQAFLAVSPVAAMEHWAFNLANLGAVLDRAEADGQDVAILFQGAVLGPVVAAYLAQTRDRRSNRVAFVDLGRLLDLSFEEDLTSTGSPLPDGSFESQGQLVQAEASDRIFTRHG